MARKLALKYLLYLCGSGVLLLLLYVAASGPVLYHVAVKKQGTTLMPRQLSQSGAFHFYLPFAPSPARSKTSAGRAYVPIDELYSPGVTPESLYAPLFDIVDKTPLQAPLDKYLRWWGVSSMRVCSNALTIFPSRPAK